MTITSKDVYSSFDGTKASGLTEQEDKSELLIIKVEISNILYFTNLDIC